MILLKSKKLVQFKRTSLITTLKAWRFQWRKLYVVKFWSFERKQDRIGLSIQESWTSQDSLKRKKSIRWLSKASETAEKFEHLVFKRNQTIWFRSEFQISQIKFRKNVSSWWTRCIWSVLLERLGISAESWLGRPISARLFTRIWQIHNQDRKLIISNYE